MKVGDKYIGKRGESSAGCTAEVLHLDVVGPHALDRYVMYTCRRVSGAAVVCARSEQQFLNWYEKVPVVPPKLLRPYVLIHKNGAMSVFITAEERDRVMEQMSTYQDISHHNPIVGKGIVTITEYEEV